MKYEITKIQVNIMQVALDHLIEHLSGMKEYFHQYGMKGYFHQCEEEIEMRLKEINLIQKNLK